MTDPIQSVQPLPFIWPTKDPFLFCVHHLDDYPAGNGNQGVDPENLLGRHLGNDFAGKDGWRMYHGTSVPGFPQHPHRGFETVTLVRDGYVDHSDSMGATGRFGHGDVQWMTAGAGVLHAEMFPLVHDDQPNRTELFQLWLNLPRANKMAEPNYVMQWAEQIPVLRQTDDAGRTATITVYAGALEGVDKPVAPPVDSWASDPANDVAVWTIHLEAGAEWTVPPAQAGTNRMLYFFDGSSVTVGGRHLEEHAALEVDPTTALHVQAGDEAVELLLLQGKPINEPVAHHGPFVMNTRQELAEAFDVYQKTQFGGWPWKQGAPVHAADAGRFAQFADGSTERPEDK